MGKRSKLFKSGNNKAYNTVMKTRRKNKLAKVLPHIKEKVKDSNDNVSINTRRKIDEKPQLRHRRIKDRSILSRGQKRRKIKKIRHEIRKNIPNKVNKIEKLAEQIKNEKIPFNLKDIDNTLMDLFEETNTKKNKKTAKLSRKEIM